MTKLPAFLFAIIMCIAVQNATAQSFTFTIVSPAANSASDSVLDINVQYYTSTYELARITAVTEGRVDTLANAGGDEGYINFNGSINIAGLIQGNTYQLKVTCRDVLGNEKTDSVNYRFINLPTGKIISPLPGNDIWPSLHIKTSHTGFDTCTSKVTVTISSNTVFTYTSVYNDIDTTIVLSNTLNYEGNVTLAVTDKWGRTIYTHCSVLADNYHSYPYLTPLYTGAGKILDYNYNKILEARNTGLYIVDSGFQTSSAIPGNYFISSSPSGKLTPYGAIWNGYEWTNGMLRTHSYLGFAGKYATYKAIWYDDINFPPTTGYGLYRRDLGTRTDTEIFHDYNPPTFDANKVDQRGSVIFYNGDNSAMGRSKVNGSSSYIADANPPYVFGGSLLYGDTVVYEISRVESPVSTTVYFNNAINNITLSQFDYGSYASYKVSGKYIAYPKPGTTNQKQVWVRDSTGIAVQRTFFGTDSYVAGLNEQGDMLFNNSNNKCYYLKKDSLNPKEIGAAISSAFYKDNTWYVIKDNSLYKINVNAYRTIAAGDWSNPASWQNGTVPPPNADVIVTTNITVDTSVTCNTLRVIPPGSITVLPGVNVTVVH
jgi:hypothetical protein